MLKMRPVRARCRIVARCGGIKERFWQLGNEEESALARASGGSFRMVYFSLRSD